MFEILLYTTLLITCLQTVPTLPFVFPSIPSAPLILPSPPSHLRVHPSNFPLLSFRDPSNLLDWLPSVGGGSSGVKIAPLREEGSELGVYADTDLEEGKVLMSVPTRSVLRVTEPPGKDEVRDGVEGEAYDGLGWVEVREGGGGGGRIIYF